ncbi:hypothetical protein CONPUDRAFT_43480, partial [Coniophora puteana RWD-64-598 SS2]
MDSTELEALDPVYVAETLSKPPFVQISGVANVRDLGSYPSSTPGKMIKPGYAFRAAEISSVTPEGIEQMKALGITIIFDLRSDPEMKKYNTPIPTIDGIDVLHNPVFKTADYSPETMAERYDLYALATTDAFMKLYSQILNKGGASFNRIFRHILSNPDSPFIFHCTAGKDRTGIVAALILKLCGVSDDAIAHDYALTRVGREPDREKVLKRLSNEPRFASDSRAALRMLSSRDETMRAFLAMLERDYGGVEAYLEKTVGLPPDEINTIRENLLVQASPE